MPQAKQTAKRKRRKITLPVMGAAGVSLALAGGASAIGKAQAAEAPRDLGPPRAVTFGEEEIADVSLATFYVFDKEAVLQDDVVLAPWTAIKFRVSGTTLTNNNQSAASSTSVTDTVNTLENLYPGGEALYPSVSSSEAANHPQPIRFINVDQILVKARSTLEIPNAMQE